MTTRSELQTLTNNQLEAKLKQATQQLYHTTKAWYPYRDFRNGRQQHFEHSELYTKLEENLRNALDIKRKRVRDIQQELNERIELKAIHDWRHTKKHGIQFDGDTGRYG